ncbi:UvrD-helicase domain-containing protein [Dietzia sp. SLG510A3-3B2-2]|jgi:superfamily I DNA/RNA helicase|nr:UvrD-helicase domain-containing protein [Dietzia sp. SLG510A3-40A3]MBB1008197.1 UvrD-helicase domain-containing protein [Dietzia sp. SLG510A3-3B2-2]
MASTNEVVVACAGSGKTTYLLERALADPTKRGLIVTYTNENLREINSRLWQESTGSLLHVETMTIFEFLLRECIKPYQNFKADIAQIRSVNFVSERPRFAKKSDFEEFYLDESNNVYRDAVSDLACLLNAESGGKVVARLESIYDAIFIDEMQDLAGWDFEFVHLLLDSSIDLTLVGDPRQSVYYTNQSAKNRNKKGESIVNWINECVDAGLCDVVEHTHSYRCVQEICAFADALFPSMTATTSRNKEQTGHDGVFLVSVGDLDAYRAEYRPQELRWDRRSRTAGALAKNFGQVKGLTYPRVLIHPTGPMMKYIENGAALPSGAVAKFYVGITRARQSVAILTEKTTTSSALPFWSPSPEAASPRG